MLKELCVVPPVVLKTGVPPELDDGVMETALVAFVVLPN
jgi:hypothetical protein